MRNIFSVMLVALSLIVSCKKDDSANKEGSVENIPAKAPVAGELVIVAKLVEVPGQFPPNELYSYAYIMKYKVEKVISGNFSGTEILVGHYNPRIARSDIKDDQQSKVGGNLKAFNPGDIHYLVLNQLDGAWTGAVEDEYYQDKSPRFWASWVDKI